MDMRTDYCFSEWVPRKRKPTRAVHLDSEVKDILGGIEGAWRAKHKNLRGLVFKGSKTGAGEPGIVAESTWHSWRKGETSPKYVELRDVAKAAGLDVRPLWQRDSGQSTEVSKLHRETQDVVRWMEKLTTDEARSAIRAAVEERMLELASRPHEAVADEGASRGRSSTR